MSSPTKDIADILIDSSVGLATAIGTDVFINEEPTKPDDCIIIFLTGGTGPDPCLDEAGADIYNPSVMIHIRGGVNKYVDTESKARNILEALHRKVITINGNRYLSIFANGDVLNIGRDLNKRPKFSVNFRLKRTT